MLSIWRANAAILTLADAIHMYVCAYLVFAGLL